jgi:hypothetical protein
MQARHTQQDEADSDDVAMEYLLEQSARALTRAGASAQDFLDALPEVRAEIRRELYDEAYLQEIERLFAACKEADASRVLSEG